MIQTIENGSVETTQELMKAVDVVVATGGGAMVKSAYSSGKPSYGVGAGNVPVIIDRDVDLKDAAEKIVAGRGVRQRHHLLARAVRADARGAVPARRSTAFMATGKVWFTEDRTQVQKLRDVVFPGGHMNKDVVGKSPREIGGARRASTCRKRARIILLPAEGAGTDDVLAKEKLCPVVAILPYKTFERGGRAGQGESAGRGRGPLGRAALATTKRTSAKRAWSCRSAGWSSTSRAR